MTINKESTVRGALALITTCAISTAAFASSTLEKMHGLNSTWNAGLSVALEGGKKSLQPGDPVRYHLSAEAGGYCYLVHVDSEGSSSLMRPSGCSAAGTGAYFPSSGSLQVSEPEGKDTVFAIMSQQPIASAEDLLKASPGYVELDSPAMDALLSGLQAASAEQQLALAQTSYLVGDSQLAMADPELQYTTRGIIRKVVESTEPQNGLEETMSEVFFDVQSISFEFDSDQLTEGGIRQLNEFGAALVSPELATLKLRVAGHTDDVGGDAYNLDLSQRRAITVAQYLEDNFSVSSDRLEAIGMGASKPLAANTTTAARAKNRRVEMAFLTE